MVLFYERIFPILPIMKGFCPAVDKEHGLSCSPGFLNDERSQISGYFGCREDAIIPL
jgi:hypothetical protein